MRRYAMSEKDLRTRLRRMEGQLRGIERMVEEDRYCPDILTQLSSVAAAVGAVGLGVLDGHLRRRLRRAPQETGVDEDVDELVAAIARFAGR